MAAMDTAAAGRLRRGKPRARGPRRRRGRSRQRAGATGGGESVGVNRPRARRGDLERRWVGRGRRDAGVRRPRRVRRSDRRCCRRGMRPGRHDRPGRPWQRMGREDNRGGRRRRGRRRRGGGLGRIAVGGGGRCRTRRRGRACRREVGLRRRSDGRWDRGRRGNRRRNSRGRGSRGQEPDRIDVSLLIGRDPDAEMDIRRRCLGIATRSDRRHRIALRDGGTRADEQRTEVRECDGVAVGRGDRDAFAG